MTSPDAADTWTSRLHGLLGMPPSLGNDVQVLRNGDEIFPAMLDAIGRAERSIDFVTFVWWQGEIARQFGAALSAAAARGARVRVLLDQFGSRKIEQPVLDQMVASGCHVRWFRPFFDGRVPRFVDANRRTHRKILVVDGHVGFCGGVGIAQEWTGDARNETEWRDTHLEIRGPAVAGLHIAFLDNWADQFDGGFDPRVEHEIDLREHGSSTCFVVRGAAETGASDVWHLLMTLVSLAERRLTIATAYFNPDVQMLTALTDAVERGVLVTLLVPGGYADKRFAKITGEQSYQRLLDAGISIRTYERSMMHAKVITVDGTVATVGSTNLNQRSMQHDEEANVVVVDPDVVAVLDAHLAEDLELSNELDPSGWADRGPAQKAAERLTTVVEKWF